MANFLHYVDTRFNAKVQVVRSNNALEKTEGSSKSLFAIKGIVHQTSYSHTPQQNCVVERKQRNLLETTRALHIQGKLPTDFGESQCCVLHI